MYRTTAQHYQMRKEHGGQPWNRNLLRQASRPAKDRAMLLLLRYKSNASPPSNISNVSDVRISLFRCATRRTGALRCSWGFCDICVITSIRYLCWNRIYIIYVIPYKHIFYKNRILSVDTSYRQYICIYTFASYAYINIHFVTYTLQCLYDVARTDFIPTIRFYF